MVLYNREDVTTHGKDLVLDLAWTWLGHSNDQNKGLA